ncbi:MAG: hypothetical protein VX278_11465 [Myxococcota bacterium]|nr:hypothetical protein [Myxococcota bacterium]
MVVPAWDGSSPGETFEPYDWISVLVLCEVTLEAISAWTEVTLAHAVSKARDRLQ